MFEDWDCIDHNTIFNVKNGILIADNVPTTNVQQFHDKMGGVRLLERSKNPFSTSYYETHAYYTCLEKAFPNFDRNSAIIMDFGCGDGRNIECLLSNGFERIVAVDLNYQSLYRFRERLSNAERKKILFINSDLFYLPILLNSIDAVITIEVLYYLNEEYEKGVEQIYTLLREGGTFITSEPTFEGALLYELATKDIRGFIETNKKSKKREEVGKNNEILTRVFKDGEVDTILVERGFYVNSHFGISAFPCLGVRTISESNYGETTIGDIQSILKKLVRDNVLPYRCVCYVSKK